MLADQYMKALATVGQSGIGWIDALFKLCVIFLVDLAELLGLTYEEVNIYISLHFSHMTISLNN